ncbi:MAG: NADH-quinone oxidoreductase subunit C [Candidatus Omnitrophica bacterium]|nr:NADH-quinone oxidoreductase subunit C [Candidatus Omnitrophota bacterium]
MTTIKEQVKEKLSGKITRWYEHSSRRIYLSLAPQDLKEAAVFLVKELGLRFCISTGIDTPKGIEILYHFSFDKSGEMFSLAVLLEDKKKPEIDSLAFLFPAAEWIEREIWELLGVNFKGHPNLKHLLLVDNWPEGKYPLRHKDES